MDTGGDSCGTRTCFIFGLLRVRVRVRSRWDWVGLVEVGAWLGSLVYFEVREGEKH